MGPLCLTEDADNVYDTIRVAIAALFEMGVLTCFELQKGNGRGKEILLPSIRDGSGRGGIEI